MTPDRFRTALTALSMSHRHFAEWTQVSDRRVRSWANGTAEVPTLLAEWLEGLAQYLEAHPMPKHRQDGTP
jgi:DNA-binding transcriptional regulator YiaG